MTRMTTLLLWTLTLAVAIALSIATIRLLDRARLEAPLGTTMYIEGTGTWIRLWPEPTVGERESTLIERGTPVEVQQLEVTEGEAWYYIQGPLYGGWIRRKNLSEVPPGTARYGDSPSSCWLRLDPGPGRAAKAVSPGSA